MSETTGLGGTILVIDDERNIRRTLRMVLEGEGATVLDADSAEEGLEMIQRALVEGPEGQRPIQVVMVDVCLPNMSGLQLLEKLCEIGGGTPPLPVILISGHATVTDAVRATRLGAFDFFEKPLARDRVIVSVRNALRHYQTEAELRSLRARARREIIGESRPMQELLRQVIKVGGTRARVLIEGESGTGKELVARAIHDASERRAAAFVKVNCAAIPRELIESELFGHERGAFTGATAQKRGLFELAHGGTLFLDEIGDMDLNAQAKVLRVLQSGELMRVGGERPIKVDVRVLAATHRNLRELVASGEFREDLYFRLAVVPIAVPPLRERPGDVALLCRYYLDLACHENGITPKRLSPAAQAALEAYPWPGNVRELRNVMERIAILSDGDIEIGDVPQEIRGDPEEEAGAPVGGEAVVQFGEGAVPPGMSLKAFRDSVERAFILQRLSEQNWNVSKTAETLDVERTHLHKKMKLLGIARGG
ncbi:two component, sigma54 specific, transcriptional regulator, Fis family [Nannocystis exedens]|uniref:Two component, sigma54 specific, transcriptional regulator, Fis family n=1 Tax=Nannocystis exedens TaxID=54 RepID=A0A1I1UFR2_9BACT|nr:sigma-54 dependent transcriptional regulator [Nannocystis exedens]PCC71673.1 two component, sigma54 specific, transcriptional regulator, Fis family protein [Nannocystis exedens]SFD69609.1 two component, sigma54 specific, transcriptional regulator, Fis family [Nannocystis exedens]